MAAASKDGWLYVLDRRNLAGGPIWRYRLAQSVDPSDPNKVGDPVAGQGSIVSPTFANGTLYAAGGITPAGEPGSAVFAAPTVGRGLILFANQNGHVTALAVPHYRP